MELLNALSTPRANELFVQNSIRANCLVTDAVGNCVYITNDISGGLHQVTTCDPTDLSKMPAVGVIVSKETDTLCTILVIGELVGLYTGLTTQKIIFVGLDGKLLEGPPAPPPSGYAFAQVMGAVTDSGRVMLVPNFHMVKRID
jgi:hypothetical protein